MTDTTDIEAQAVKAVDYLLCTDALSSSDYRPEIEAEIERCLKDALERQQAVIKRLREDMMDAVEGLGVRPMCYNGLHRAWLNQTNADVETFKTAKECAAWCDEINRRFGNEGLEQTGNHISAQLERQQAVVIAMRTIKEKEGQVCGEYETCTHTACQSSYNAWAIADAALAVLDKGKGDGQS